ncbi:arylsulfatase B-like [Glandiceps talaboti]
MGLVEKVQFLCCVILCALSVPIDAKKPNIVYILADDLGWSDIGFNNPYVKSPNIDQLASEGVILDQHYVSPLCSPTRAAFLTGYYPWRTGYQHSTLTKYQLKGLPLNTTTIAQELKALNYNTYMIGKWHLGFCNYVYTPHGRGFDKYYGYYTGEVDYLTHKNAEYLDLRENDEPDFGSDGTYSTEIFASKAEKYIDGQPKCKPMFLYLAFLSVHAPIMPEEKYTKMYENVTNINRRKKMAMVTAMDDAIGIVVDALKRKGLWENTILVFSSDNGGPQDDKMEGINYPLRGGKASCWEGGTRAASFVWSRRLQKTGYRNKQMMHIVDWFPTFINLAGGTLDAARDHDGYNIWDAVSKDASSPRTRFVYHIDEIKHQWAIRDGDYKAINGSSLGVRTNWYRYPPEIVTNETLQFSLSVRWHKVLLYNIAEDPYETTDLAPTMEGKVNDMTDLYETYLQKLMPSFDGTRDGPAGDAAARAGNFYTHGFCDAV